MIIEVAERAERDGIYKVSHNGRPLCDSPCPPLDGARLLLAQGYDPDATVVMRRAGSDMEALRGRLGTVANLRIGGDGVGFRRGRQPVQASPMRFGADKPLEIEQTPLTFTDAPGEAIRVWRADDQQPAVLPRRRRRRRRRCGSIAITKWQFRDRTSQRPALTAAILYAHAERVVDP